VTVRRSGGVNTDWRHATGGGGWLVGFSYSSDVMMYGRLHESACVLLKQMPCWHVL
jgi:hypothetical protein